MAESIFSRGPLPAPLDYVVPGSSSIVPLSAYADFDGTGASGAFVPTLVFKDQSGNVIGQSQASTTVAAGASASMSWFPGVKAAAAATPASSVGLPVAMLATDVAGVSIPSTGSQNFVSIQNGVSGAIFSASDASVYTNGSSTSFTGSAVFGVQIHAAGTYAVFNNAFDKSGGTAGKQLNTYWAASAGSAPSLFQQGRSAAGNIDTWDKGQSGQGPHNFLHEWMTVTSGQVPATLAVWGGIVGGGGAIVVAFEMAVVQLTTNVLSVL